MGDALEDFAYRAIGFEACERIDLVTIQVMDALQEANVRALLLKGPVIAQWLYDPGEVRGYNDCDVLAAPDRFASAGRAMGAAGFHLHSDEATHPEVLDQGRSQIWHRLPEDVWIDLQWRLPGFGLAPGLAWERLWDGRETMNLRSGNVAVAGEPARTLHLATAAVPADSESRKALIDLERAIVRLDPDVWRAAARLADQVDAMPALRAGLNRTSAGASLAARLGLTLGSAP
jgi:hypothetical protein